MIPALFFRSAIGAVLFTRLFAAAPEALQLYRNDAVTAEFRAAHPQLLDLSPDASQVLLRQKESGSTRAENLVIKQVADNQIVGSMRSAEPTQRVRWSPDRRSVAFFCRHQENNLRDLFVWRLGEDQPRALPIPVSIAQPDVRWSPDSRFLAFTSLPDSLVMVDVSNATYAVHEGKARAFDWCDDSRQLALITGKGDTIRIIEPAAATVVREFKALQQFSLSEIAWQRGRGLLLHYSDDKQQTSHLFVADPVTGEHTAIVDAGHAIRDIQWAGKGVTCSFRVGVTKRALVWSDVSSKPRELAGRGSLTLLPATDPETVPALQVSATEGAFIQFFPRPAAPRICLNQTSPHAATATEGEIQISIGDLKPASGWLVRNRAPTNRPAAVVLLSTGGPDADWPPERWAETQLYLARGAHVLQLIVDLKAHSAETINGACRYLVDTLGVPSERIAVVGLSNAAAAAVLAVQTDPAAFGVLVTIGLLSAKPPPANFAAQTTRPTILAFHGEKDPYLAPEKSWKLLKAALRLPEDPGGRTLWHVFPGEYHSLLFDENRAAIVNTTLIALGLGESGVALN